jgi:hypothetical protein
MLIRKQPINWCGTGYFVWSGRSGFLYYNLSICVVLLLTCGVYEALFLFDQNLSIMCLTMICEWLWTDFCFIVCDNINIGVSHYRQKD